MQVGEAVEAKWNLEILGFERGRRKVLHQRTHNIVVNNGRQFIAEAHAASAFSSGAGFTRVRNECVRYVGVGIGGSRQTSALASSGYFPQVYPGTNAQTDDDLTVSRLERPVKATNALWLKQVAAPPQFPNATAVRWTALFDADDVNIAPWPEVPVSEIGLYSSGANPEQPNGGIGSYPGSTMSMIAYDTFASLPKTAYWSMVVNWTWQF